MIKMFIKYIPLTLLTRVRVSFVNEKKTIKHQEYKANLGNRVEKKEQKKGEGGSKQMKMKIIDFKKYGRQVQQIMMKKDVSDIDLVLISAKINNKEIHLNQTISDIIKIKIKQLKHVDYSLIPILIDLAFSIGLVSPPEVFVQSYYEYYRYNKFSIEENQVLKFPTYFLKKVGFKMVNILMERSMEQMSLGLKYFVNLLSLNEIQKIDLSCTERIQKMKIDEIVSILNIFRQMKKKGRFVEIAMETILNKQHQLSNKYCITFLICCLELHADQASFQRFSQHIIQRILKKSFKDGEVVSLIHILHKYKTGKAQIWQCLLAFLKKKGQKIPFQHLYPLICGLCRNFILNSQLLLQLLDQDGRLTYVDSFTCNQFIEFFVVIYANFKALQPKERQKYKTLIIESIKSKELKSVYKQIKFFFLYLFETNKDLKNEYLRKSYPSQVLLSLLSLHFQTQTIDIRQKQDYLKDILMRFPQQIWQLNKQDIIIQQFIRYKLMSISNNPESKQ